MVYVIYFLICYVFACYLYSLNLSASSRKVEDLEDTLILKPCISGYCIIDVAVLVSVFSSFLCPECGSPTLIR